MDDHYETEMRQDHELGMINQRELPYRESQLAQVSDNNEIQVLHETLAIGDMRRPGPRRHEEFG